MGVSPGHEKARSTKNSIIIIIIIIIRQLTCSQITMMRLQGGRGLWNCGLEPFGSTWVGSSHAGESKILRTSQPTRPAEVDPRVCFLSFLLSEIGGDIG